MNVVRAVPGDRLVRPDGVELDPEGLGLADQIEGVVDGFEVSRSYFSDWSHMSVSYSNDIEHDRTVPALRRLAAIAAALETDARGLLKGVPPYGSL
ncbi:MAG: hypothetical protein ACR2KL_11080 [Nocardioidaceae bacterium]